MKKLLLTLLTLTLAALSMNAQSLSVTDISEQTTSLRARTAQVRDNNGELCALIEVAIPSVEGLTFDANKVVRSSYSDGIYSLYVPAGTKSISYKHKDYLPGTIDFNGISIVGGSTYRVILKKNDSAPEYQFLVINVTPRTAAVEVDGQSQVVTDGAVQMYLEVGTFHHYKVTASGMRTEEGEAYIATAEQKTIVNVNMVENVTPVRIVAPAKADIYLNERMLGNGTWEGSIAPGTYRVEAKIDGITIADEVKTVQISANVQQIELTVRYGTLVVTSNVPNATILMDGEAIGETPLRLAKIMPGKHVLTLSKDGYKYASDNVIVRPGEETKAEMKLEAIAKEQPTTLETSKPKTEVQKPVEQKTAEPKPAKEPKVATPKPEKAPKPAKTGTKPFIFAGANVGYGISTGTLSYGVKAGAAGKVGGYVSARSNFKFLSAAAGEYDSSEVVWGKQQYEVSRISVTAGALVNAFGPFYPYVGVGYGARNLYSQIVDNSTDYALISDFSYSGIALEGGLMVKLGAVMLSAGVNSVAFKYGDVELGVCIAF